MNEIARTTQSFGLIPSSMSEAMQLAEMMATAKLVPKDLQKSPADCLMVIQQAVRWQMDPFAVAQECSVIQGKLMHSGKLVAAVVNSRGNLSERLSFEYTGTNGDRAIIVSGKLQGENAARTVTVALKDAKTANAMWQKQPDQQLMYSGTRVWARRHTPELMLGVYSPEEFDETTVREMRDVTPAKPIPAPLQISPPAPIAPPSDPETGELGPHLIAVVQTADDKPDFRLWASSFIAAVKSATTLAEANKWSDLNAVPIASLKQYAPKMYSNMMTAVGKHRDTLAPEVEAEVVDDVDDQLNLLKAG